MLTLILAVVLGIVFSILASENPSIISLSIFGAVLALPLYIIIALSFLGGIVIVSVISLFDMTTTAFSLQNKESKIREVAKTNQTLQLQLQKISEENARLKQEVIDTRNELKETRLNQKKDSIKNFFGKIRQSFS